MKFKPEDFGNSNLMGITIRNNSISIGDAADQANAKLKEWLDAAPTVYSDEKRLWTNYKDEDDKVVGKIVCIEKIKKECFKHEPEDGWFILSSPTKCKHCGVQLFAEWKAK